LVPGQRGIPPLGPDPGRRVREVPRLPTRIGRYVDYLRLRPFETATATGRGAERQRRLALTALASAAARIVAIATSLAAIPLALGYLGPERYGLYATLSAVSTILVFADFGIGNGLLNLIAESSGHGDTAAARRSVSTAVFTLTAIALALGLVLAVAFAVVPWSSLANVHSATAVGEAAPAVGVAALAFVLSIPLGVVQRIQLGMQEGFRNSVWVAAGSVLSLVGVLLAIAIDAGTPGIVLALMGGPVLAMALNWVALQRRDLEWTRPSWSFVDSTIGRRLARLGFLFFVLQLCFAVSYQSDVLIAARVIGPEAAATYSVTLRLFLFGQSLATMVLIPLWPAYAEAIQRGDLPWVRRTLRRSIVAAALVTAGWSVLMAIGGPLLVFGLMAPGLTPPLALIAGAAVWAVLSTTFSAGAMVLNAASVIRFQVVTAVLMLVASVGLSWVMAIWYGLGGVIWGTVIAYLVCVGGPMVFYLPRLLARLEPRPS
jgi:O-antigen/teichoic acid export membrane protein